MERVTNNMFFVGNSKDILYDISVGIFSFMILVWCIDRIQLSETERKETKQRLILYNKMAPILTKYYEFYLYLYIATRNKPVKSNDNVLESLYYCKEEFITQIYNTNPFYKDGYYGDSTKLRLQLTLMEANSSDPQAMEQIMKMSTNLPWYKCWCKDGTEFYNNISQIERDYISLFPNKLLELLDRLLDIVGAQRYIDEFVEGKKRLELLPHDIPMPQLPTDFFVDAYKMEEVLMLHYASQSFPYTPCLLMKAGGDFLLISHKSRPLSCRFKMSLPAPAATAFSRQRRQSV